jgi:hypothetical protein
LQKSSNPFSIEDFVCFLTQILVSFPNMIEMMMEGGVVVLPFVATPPSL